MLMLIIVVMVLVYVRRAGTEELSEPSDAGCASTWS